MESKPEPARDEPDLITPSAEAPPLAARPREATMLERPPPPPVTPPVPTYFLALEAVRPELEAMRPADVVSTSTLDLAEGSRVVTAALPRLRAFRGEVASELGEARAAHLDRLELVMNAALQADACYRAAANPLDVTPVTDALREMRALLLSDVQSLILRKLLPESVLASLRGGKSHLAYIGDVLQLVSALRACWPEIEARTPLTLRDLDRAEYLANELVVALGVRAQPVAATDAETRRRALSLFVRTYEQVRRAIAFLRWEEDDASEIAPSLFARRRRRRSESSPSPERGTDGEPVGEGRPA